jgi:hypothetical protein
MKKSPLAAVKDKFESKEKLVEAVQAFTKSDLWVDQVNGAKGLGRVSNAKLLRLHAILKDAQERFGSREKLVSAILDATGRAKDAALRTKLGTYTLPQLLDLQRVAVRKAKAAAK